MITQEGDYIVLKFLAIAPVGKYKLSIRVADIFDAAATIDIPFEIYENHPPKQVKEFEKIFIPSNRADYSINLSEYFTDEDGHTITYTARSADPSTMGVTLSGDKLMLNPARLGLVTIQVKATDSQDASVLATITLQVVEDGLVYIVYPIPATKVLNARLSDEVQNATISIRTSTGTQVLQQNVAASTSEQRLVQLDISKISGGTYILHVEANGKTFKKSFIKI